MDARQAWQSVMGQLQRDMDKSQFETWVRDADLVSYENNNFVVGTHNAYACDYLERRLSSTITRHLSGLMGLSQTVKFVVHHSEPVEPEPAEPKELPAPTREWAEGREISYINPRYKFDNFVVGPSNRLAHAACLSVADNPARSYNPLFLYGGVGLGKTHLLHAIGNGAVSHGLRVLYVSSESFTNDLINAIRTHTTQAFRERYRSIDVLLVDDIQFIANKESTQEEFFHTFNTLHGQDKQIVMSSDRPPKAMVTLEERLRSRFEWGLAADIQPPDLETRIAILRSKAERTGNQVPDDILETIARLVQSNIRELEGALIRVTAFAYLREQRLTQELVNVALADMLPQRNSVEPEQVVHAVAQAFGVPKSRMLSRDRSQDVALPRQVAMYLLREEANVSLPQIGEFLGGRDHTTVMYACQKIADLIERDDRLRRTVLQLREQVFGRTVANPA